MDLGQLGFLETVDHAHFLKRTPEPGHMGSEVDQAPPDNRGDFVHRVAEQEATIEDGDLGFVFGNVAAIEVNGAHGGLGLRC
ncbi:hypothetical protein FQZ97_859800 [compost metagenome]